MARLGWKGRNTLGYSALFLFTAPLAADEYGDAIVSLAQAAANGVPVIAYGQFINVVMNFVIVAFAVFLLVKGINAVRRQPATPPPPTTQEKLLMEIRDALRARN